LAGSTLSDQDVLIRFPAGFHSCAPEEFITKSKKAEIMIVGLFIRH
jgi:hypothetical protein